MSGIYFHVTIEKINEGYIVDAINCKKSFFRYKNEAVIYAISLLEKL